MRPIRVMQLDYDLTPTAGLALGGHFLKTLGPARADVDALLSVRIGVTTSDIMRSYLGLLVQGKSDFDAIENLCGDKSFKQPLGLGLLPSGPTPRQRRDAHAAALSGHVMSMIERPIAHHAPGYGALSERVPPSFACVAEKAIKSRHGFVCQNVSALAAGVGGSCARGCRRDHGVLRPEPSRRWVSSR